MTDLVRRAVDLIVVTGQREDLAAAPPASTTIGVPQLARPGAVFEIEAIAVLPSK
jgi:enamine deaminase RidA (YjgF/YER057c/UK114 family)